MNSAGSLNVRTSHAEFEILPSGYVRGLLRRSGESLTLDEPDSRGGSSVTVNGRIIQDFRLDCARARSKDATGRLGAAGKRIEIEARSASFPALEETIVFEVYDDFPDVLLETVTWRNIGPADLTVHVTAVQRQRLSAAQIEPGMPPYKMWSFQGASEEWGKDDVVLLSRKFSRANPMQQLTFSPKGAGGAGGGIPVVAFWTAKMGEAIGQVDTIPLVLSMPVQTLSDGRVSAAISLKDNAPVVLHSGDVYSAPTTFLAVFHGDYYEPLSLYSKMLRRQGWAPAHPVAADYDANWCSWGYQLQFTPAQVIGTIPKIREFGMRWTTLDAGWYDNRGDWNPRSDIGLDGIRRIVNAYHQAGLRITLWWIPLAAESGGTDVLDGRPYHVAKILREHPEWLILDEKGKPARMAGGFAALCPAINEVRDYYRGLTERFIRDWEFDGNKLDFSYTVPPCYNPAHRHQSPQDSIRAVGDVYQTILQTTRALKLDSVTQVCPCGTTPSLAWLADFDQAVTADPVGSVQVRRRIKMYKALLGPEAPVYGDHVELTRVVGLDSVEKDLGRDFASTVGLGGVVGTKFTWPPDASQFQDARLTADKDAIWRKWIAIYNQKMLSSGSFRDLYVYGYDSPEGYAIEKDGRMYYAFFTDKPQMHAERIELRGLGRGHFHVVDYENGRDYGKLDGTDPHLEAKFQQHLLLEVSKIQP
jgi:alpha-galactosidase